METTETFKRVYVNGDEKNLPEIGTETIYFKPYVGIYTGQYLEEDKETWMNDVVWYLSPINEAQGKEEYPETHTDFYYTPKNQERFLGTVPVDQPKEQPERFDHLINEASKSEKPEPVSADEWIKDKHIDPDKIVFCTDGVFAYKLEALLEEYATLRAAQGKGKEQPERRRTAEEQEWIEHWISNVNYQLDNIGNGYAAITVYEEQKDLFVKALQEYAREGVPSVSNEEIETIVRKHFQKVNSEGMGFLETNIVTCIKELSAKINPL
jgi:hypothetical protein